MSYVHVVCEIQYVCARDVIVTHKPHTDIYMQLQWYYISDSYLYITTIYHYILHYSIRCVFNCLCNRMMVFHQHCFTNLYSIRFSVFSIILLKLQQRGLKSSSTLTFNVSQKTYFKKLCDVQQC